MRSRLSLRTDAAAALDGDVARPEHDGRGEHDLATADEVRGVLEATVAAGLGTVVELSITDFIDSSILGVLLLAAGQGSQVTVRCEGQDEEEALRAVTTLIANRFDEEG